MAGHPILTGSTSVEITVLRRAAGDLLDRLISDCEAAERRLNETGRRDPIRAVTCSSALENAIVATRDMIAQMDLLLHDLETGIAGASSYTADNNGYAAQPSARRESPAAASPSGTSAPGRPRSRGMLPGRPRSVVATA